MFTLCLIEVCRAAGTLDEAWAALDSTGLDVEGQTA
jgi:hypothetical protein